MRKTVLLLTTALVFNLSYAQELWDQATSKTNFIEFKGPKNHENKLKSNNQKTNSVHYRSIFVNKFGEEVGFIGNQIIVRVDQANNFLDYAKVNKLNYKKLKYNEDKFIINLGEITEGHLIETVKNLRKQRFIQYVAPNYHYYTKLADPYFNTGQWYLRDPSVGIDIDNAHLISKGCNTIRVAVMDTGIDLDHEDLSGNVDSRHFDVESDKEGFAEGDIYCNGTDCGHGTAVAGIIGAEQNGIGMIGVSPKVTLVSVRIKDVGSTITSEQYIRAFDWCRLNQIDVLNASFGIDTELLIDNNISKALERLIVQGRNGKGTTVVAAAGNSNVAEVAYPASSPNVIAVGATTHKGVRWSEGNEGSNYGENLDVVAASHKVSNVGQIISADIMGGWGKSDDNYAKVGATSFAAPQVTGVVALLNSINNDLSPASVKEIICRSSDRISGFGSVQYTYNTVSDYGTRNEELGYGKLNAPNAIIEATLDAPNQIINDCKSSYEAKFAKYWNSLPSNISWKYGTGLNVTNHGTSLTFSANSNANGSNSWIEVSFMGTCEMITIRKELEVIDLSGFDSNDIITSAEDICQTPGSTSVIEINKDIPTQAYSLSTIAVGSGLTKVSLSGNKLTVRANSNWTEANSFVKVTLNRCGGSNNSSLVFVRASTGDMELPAYMLAPCPACINQQYLFYGHIPGNESISWSWPSGWTYLGGQGTSNLRLKVGRRAGDVSYVATDDCGGSVTLSRFIPPVNCSLYGCGSAVRSKSSQGTNESNLIKISSVIPDAQEYRWELPSDWELVEENNGSVTIRMNGTGSENIISHYKTSFGWESKEIPVFNIADHHSDAGQSLEESISITTYPNPSQETLRISATQFLNNALVNVIGMDGKTYISKRMNQQQLDIDIAQLPRGLYIVKLNESNQIITEKIYLGN